MTTDKCFSCKRNHKSLLCKICGVGMNGEREYYTRKPITNADRIRAMSDEELADFMTDDFCELLCKSPIACDGQCKLKLLQWLKQEIE